MLNHSGENALIYTAGSRRFMCETLNGHGGTTRSQRHVCDDPTIYCFLASLMAYLMVGQLHPCETGIFHGKSWMHHLWTPYFLTSLRWDPLGCDSPWGI